MRRPLFPADEEFFRVVESSGTTGTLYRQRGITLSPEQYHASLWNGVLVQHVIANDQDGAPLGIICCYAADFRNQHAALALLLTESARLVGWPFAHVFDFVDELFDNFGFRKLYAEVAEFNLPQFASLTSSQAIRLEGRLKDHEYHAGRYWDSLTFAIHQADWKQYRESWLDRASAIETLEAILARHGVGTERGEREAAEIRAIGLDSLEMIEVVECLRTLASHEVSDDLIESLVSVADIDYWVKRFTWGEETASDG